MTKKVVEIKVEDTPKMQNGWMVFANFSCGANVERTHKDKNVRTLWAKYSDSDVQFAYPMHAGTGPQPENTVTLVELQDMLFNTVVALEQTLDNIENKEKENQGEW